MKKIYLIILSFLILSCSNDETNQPPEETEPLFLKQVFENGTILNKYVYENDLISIKESYNSGQLWLVEEIEYTNDTVFNRSYNSSGELQGIRKYYSISENVSKRDRFDSNGVMINYWIYTFSNNNCGFISLDIYDNDDNLTSQSTFDYTDSNCSSESILYEPTGQIVWEEEFIRDDKNQYNKSQYLDFFRAENLGNTTSYKRWDSQNNLESGISYDSSFEFNSSNYPISEQRVYLDGTLKVYTFEYY